MPSVLLQTGDPWPWVDQRSPSLERFAVDHMAGRYLVLCFVGSLRDAVGQSAWAAVQRHRNIFNDRDASFFGVSCDRQDETERRVSESLPGIRLLWDFDHALSNACGVTLAQQGRSVKVFRRLWIVVDPTLHVLATFPFPKVAPDHEQVFHFLKQLPPPSNFAGFEIPAPVLVLPHVFEHDLCRRLIQLYDADGGNPSGVMRDEKGVFDASFKSRRDYTLTDAQLIRFIQRKIATRVAPEIKKLFFMDITRMERYLVGCYTTEDGGFFRPHRDNQDYVTAHRRFAVSINLNDDFSGGTVQFPEYNLRGITAPPGWAVVFPCAILHAVTRVTRGRRYAFLPFVYDEEGAKIGQAARREYRKGLNVR
jgi:peroxiredoxin/predicted 2-oxoglutarate/Fe(II)-dependent dioxygenase YbiX